MYVCVTVTLVSFLPGVFACLHAAQGALIAPGSLVLKPVEPNTMVAGAPAQFVGCRKALNAQQQQLQQLEQEVLPAVVLPAAAAAPATAEHSQQQQQQHLEQQEEQQPTYSKMQTWAASTTQVGLLRTCA